MLNRHHTATRRDQCNRNNISTNTFRVEEGMLLRVALVARTILTLIIGGTGRIQRRMLPLLLHLSARCSFRPIAKVNSGDDRDIRHPESRLTPPSPPM